MKIRKYIPALLISTLICSSLLAGCKQDSDEPVATVEEIPIETIVTTQEESIAETESIEAETEVITETVSTKTITITVLNLSDVNIGMFSAIDPTTKEQLNFNRLDSNTSLSFECNWPSDTDKFQWALYNEAGELCLEAATDVSTATKSATLILKGEGSVDDVDVTIE